MSIHNLPDKIKRYTGLDHIVLINILVIVLVGLSAFGLGRLSVQSNTSLDLGASIYNAKAVDNITTGNSTNIPVNKVSGGKYVASKNGKLYYTVGCSGAKRIKDSNRIWFDTKTEAEKYGLTLSPTCK
jgi:hypothetical protein